jgi:uncharacterized protein YjbI with pentapeptide repeats
MFATCDLNESNFEGTKLSGVDISTCTFNQLNVSIADLGGCVVSEEQAIGFARLIGLEIKE